MEPLPRVEETLISGSPCSRTPSQSSLNNDPDEEERDYDEEEDDDVDFNPLLKDSPSREASSSLSSEIETLDGEIVDSVAVVPQSREEEKEVIANVESISKDSQFDAQSKFDSDPGPQKGGELDNSAVEANENGEMVETQNQVLMSDEEDDAICKRTRARYSLESFTLDDLEAFLQETDDEDDIPNVDDEAEYRKFLAAVLQSGYPEVQSVKNGNNNDDDDDDDEDNDLDFEIELEEALETDDDESIPEKVTTDDNESTKRRPVTRQKRRQNNSTQHRINSSEQSNILLRPLLPIFRTAQPVRSFPATASSGDSVMYGFSQAQMGELHCMIHDHLQLLIQVYSLCALDHSRQRIGTQLQGLISEMIQRHQGHVSRPSQLLVTRSTSSVLGVVDLAGGYLVDVSNVVQDYRRCQVEESGFDALSLRVPLFPLPHQEVGRQMVNSSPSSPSTSKSPSNQQQPKKTLAATLVESAKKESVALVHKDIAKLAKRFLSLFKVSLFPHKPPPVAVCSRFLFTDAEDELLALGIMEYNSDWKAIKQRFLPCKGEHQIYVRQKNRRSSKAPENPIKAVLRMKSSPLTPQEIVRIQEGLKYFKYDWMSVWKFIVPYRDPSLLPRQLRTALGIQKSYKLDAVKNEKRRLYDTQRKSREQLTSAREDRPGASKANENQVGDGLVNNSGEAYLHEGFLAEWRPGMPHFLYYTSMHSFDKGKDVPRETVQTCTGEGSKNPQLCGAQILTCTRRLAPSFIPLYHHTSVTPPDASRAPITMLPYRSRKLCKRSVVRLAPDLPPVNLPSSVRVISQSVFVKNQSETSSKTCIIKAGISDVSGRGNLGTEPPCSSADGDNNGPSSEKVVDLQEAVPAESSSGMGETNNDSGVQMHPLLFRSPEHGQITCYSSKRDTGGSTSFSFFPDNRPQLLSLFNSPRQINHSADEFQKKSSLNEHEAAVGESCFHPLLQRTEYETSRLTSRRGNLDLDIGKKGKLCQLQDTSSAGRSDASLKHFSSENVNLDINLSSSCSKVKDCGGVSARNTSEVPDMCMIQRNNGSQVPVSTATSGDISRCMNEMADQSNLGIVMEQEELSDSDEEMTEEHVEFECEEMADSEGEEGSECEETIEMQDKDNRSSEVELASADVDSGKELGRDSPNSPWLRLDPSSRPLSSSSSEVKEIERREPETKTSMTQYGPSRSRKKRTPMRSRDAESEEDAGDARLRLGPLAFPSMKKPKKCVGQAETSPNIETT